jgi:acylphosphatase
MLNLAHIVAMSAVLPVLSVTAFAATYNCSVFSLPQGSSISQVGGINNAGTISGSYRDTAGHFHGFIDNPSTGNLLTVDYPGGASQIFLYNINNNGVAVGNAFTTTVTMFFTVDSSGNFHSIPLASGYKISSVYGINDAGDISAVVTPPGGGFIYALIETDGTVLNYGANPTSVGSVNNARQMIVGSGNMSAIVDSNGNVTPLQDPNFPSQNRTTNGTTINNPGTVVGGVGTPDLPARSYARDPAGVYSETFCGPNLPINSALHSWAAINDNGVLISNDAIATPLPGLAQATVSSSSITFPPAVTGQPSTPQSLTIANSGNARMDIASIYIIQNFRTGGSFGFSGCGGGVTSLDPGASCTLTLTATPTQAGTSTTTMVIEDSAPGGPHLVTLSVTGSSGPPPTCSVTSTNPGPPASVIFTMQDTSSGLASITVVQTVNATTNVPTFTHGTTAPVNASATQIDTSKASSVEFLVTNVNGGATTCSTNFGGSGSATWMGLGGSITGHISVVSNSNGALQAFARGTDNALWTVAQTTPDGAWGTWQSIGGALASDPAAVQNGNDLLDVFVLGTDHSLWEASQSSSNGPFIWQGLGQSLTGTPAATVNADGRVQVLAAGNDQALWTIAETAPGGTWSGWTSLGGAMLRSPAAITNTNGTVEAFVIGTDNGVWHIWQTSPGGSWSSWDGLGGSIGGNPVALSNTSSGLAEIFGLGTDGAIWNISHPSGSGWSGWTSLGGFLTSDPSAAFDTNGITEVFARGGDNGLWRITNTASGPPTGWNSWLPLNGTLANGPTAAVNQDGRIAIFVEGSDTAMWTIEQASAGSWGQ